MFIRLKILCPFISYNIKDFFHPRVEHKAMTSSQYTTEKPTLIILTVVVKTTPPVLGIIQGVEKRFGLLYIFRLYR